MKTFLSIPHFRDMHYLHGILIYGSMWVLIVLGVMHFLIMPDHRHDLDTNLVRCALFLAGFYLVPIVALIYSIPGREYARAKNK